ncbi:TPA_asm: hypothetical protein GHP91_04300 [Listeria monocytogenes]|nr:hypothetical protein [Listeria monocytogenes]
MKYITRESMKGGIEDLQKAQWYLDYLIAFNTSVPFKSRAEIDEILDYYDRLEAGIKDLQDRMMLECETYE